MIPFICLKLKKICSKFTVLSPIFDLEKLQDKTLKWAITIELYKRFKALSVPEEAECETVWEAVKESYHEIAKSTLGARRSKEDQWLPEQMWQIIEERKKKKVTLLLQKVPDRLVLRNEKYRALDKDIKKSDCTDKWNFL